MSGWDVAVLLIAVFVVIVLVLLVLWRIDVSRQAIAYQRLVAEALRIAKDIENSERAAWESLLIERLGSYYLPRYLADKRSNKDSEWDYVEEDKSLPRVLIIGDSISRGYTLPVRYALTGIANVLRAPENCRSSRNGVAMLDTWLGLNSNYDIIVTNFGIHDRNRTLDAYRSDVETILARLTSHTKKLIWVTTTPLPNYPDKLTDFLSFDQYNAMAIYRRGHNSAELNTVATPLAEAAGALIYDLNSFVASNAKQEMCEYDVHFTWAGYELLGEEIALVIKQVLNDADMQ